MNHDIFFDYAYNDSNAYHGLEKDLKSKGASLMFPLEAKELGAGIGAMIKQCKFLLFPTDSGKIDRSHLQIAKENKIPYCIVAVSNYNRVLASFSQEEHNRIFNYEHSGHRMRLYELLCSYECLTAINQNIATNYTMKEAHNQNYKYDLYISYNRKDIEIATKIKMILGCHLNVYMADDSSCMAGNFEMIINDAIKQSKKYLILLTSDCLSNYTSWSGELRSIIKEVDSCSSKSLLPVNVDNQFKFVTYGEKFYPEIVRIMQYNWLVLDSSQYETNCKQIIEVVECKTKSPGSNQENFHHDIFVAYARLDKQAGDKVCAILRKNGFSLWRDADSINVCDEFAHVITDAIDEAKVFLLIESKWSKDSAWVKRELEYARSKSKHIVQILTDSQDGLSNLRRLTFSANSLELGTEYFEEKLLANILSKGCTSNTNVILNEGKQLYREIETNSSLSSQIKEDIGYQSFNLFLRAAELGDENASMFIDRKPWDINLIEATKRYHEIYSNFLDDLRKSIYNKGIIIAEDDTVSDIPQRGRGMERTAFRFMKRAINLGHGGESPENYDWYYLDNNDFEKCKEELGKSSSYVELSYADRKRNLINSLSTNNTNKAERKEPDAASDINLFDKIFISYKRLDKDKVFPIVDEIYKRTGVKCWIDLEGIESGDQFQNVIINAIDNAEIVVFMLSKNFISPYVDPETGKVNLRKQTFPQKEIMYALNEDKRLVPVSIDGTTVFDCKWLKFNCSGLDSIDYSNEDQRNKFFRDVTSWLGTQSTKEYKLDTENGHTPTKVLGNQGNIIDSFEDSVDLQLAWLEYDSENYKEALRQFLLVAKRGNANALNAIGLYYYEGKACKHNYQQALSYFQKAANLGYASAMRNVGDCYRLGHGVTKSMTNAIKWYQLAADKKNLKAIFLLAECLAKADANKYHYYQEAAHMGHEEAIMIIKKAEELYRNGFQLLMDDRDSENIEKAAYCNLRQAAEYGHPDAYRKVYEENIWVIDTEKVWREFNDQTSIQ